jgi:hypothetical protein
MQTIVDVTCETTEGTAVFKIQAVNPFVAYRGLNMLLKLLANDGFNSEKPEVAILINALANCTELQVREFCTMFLGNGKVIIANGVRDVNNKILEQLFLGNPSEILVLLTEALILNYANFSGALDKIKARVESIFQKSPSESNPNPA